MPRKKRIHQSELSVSLCEQILQYVTFRGEVVLDSFAGSGVVSGKEIVGSKGLENIGDGLLTKCHHRIIMMIEYFEKTII